MEKHIKMGFERKINYKEIYEGICVFESKSYLDGEIISLEKGITEVKNIENIKNIEKINTNSDAGYYGLFSKEFLEQRRTENTFSDDIKKKLCDELNRNVEDLFSNYNEYILGIYNPSSEFILGMDGLFLPQSICFSSTNGLIRKKYFDLEKMRAYLLEHPNVFKKVSEIKVINTYDPDDEVDLTMSFLFCPTKEEFNNSLYENRKTISAFKVIENTYLKQFVINPEFF